jgi:predicted DsbA family dithiol-disulfide isomerase
MTQTIAIDFVSDIACPWCVIGLWGLDQARTALGGEIEAEIHFRPFELSPELPRGGVNLFEHMGRKTGATREQSLAARAAITERAAALGFAMRYGDDFRAYNTFDAHRLLHWAGLTGGQHALKRALFEAYFDRNEAIDDPAVLAEVAGRAGRNPAEALHVLEAGQYVDDVRAEEQLWQSRGINAVPSIVIDQRYLISGGQPAEAFVQALRSVVAQRSAA